MKSLNLKNGTNLLKTLAKQNIFKKCISLGIKQSTIKSIRIICFTLVKNQTNKQTN